MTATLFRLLLVDDHVIFREGLRALVARVPDWTVVGEADDGLEGVKLGLALKPDVVVTDLLMSGANGLEVARRLRNAGFNGGIVLLSAHVGEELIRDATLAGVDRVLPKLNSFSELEAAVREAAGCAHSSHARSTDRTAKPTAVASLTPRETQVLRLIAEGHSSKAIGDKLGISPRTVDVHRHRLQLKLRASGAAELTRIAVRAGLAEL